MVRALQRHRHCRLGMSLMSALLLSTIVALVAATMVAVYSMNLSMTQRTYNGSVALAEAEAGIAEMLYRISLPENFEDPNGDPTKVLYGLNGETVRNTATPGLSPEQAYHVVTFDSSSSYPRSTNNSFGDQPSGSLGRTVPAGRFHLVSTGYCNGQYRTVECVVEKPPFPFGLAASGPIHSRDPFIVKGVRNIQELIDDEETRPGHILCNSEEGVVIDQTSPERPTYISGFVKSVGPIEIAQPADVVGGIRPFADRSTLPSIEVRPFRNEGQPGVVTLLDNVYHQPQNKDIMYFYRGDQLTYESSVQLDKAMLYVEGDLRIRGPLSGEGLIVVDGNAIFESGAALSGSNKMAVICSGDVTIRGNNNFFTGLVYCGGNFDASNVTIVGNAVINSMDPNRGRVDLTNVTVVSNEETANMTIEVTSNDGVKEFNNLGRAPFPLQSTGGVFGIPPGTVDGGGLNGWPPDGSTAGDIASLTIAGLWEPLLENGPGSIQLGNPPADPQGAVVWTQAISLYEEADKAAQLQVEIEELREALSPGPSNPDEIQRLQNELNEKLNDQAAHRDEFQRIALAIGEAFVRLMDQRVNENGTYNTGHQDMNYTQLHHFDLNEYLPESEKVKIAFWRVYNQKL